MRRHRFLPLLAAPTLVIATVSVATTPAAASSTVTVALNCSVAAPVTITAAIGDTLVINAAANCDQLANSQSDPNSPALSGFLGAPASTPAGFTFLPANNNADDWVLLGGNPQSSTWSVSMTILATSSAGSLSSGGTLGVYSPNTSGGPHVYYPLVFSTGGSSSGGSSSSGAAPAPVFQAVALPASGTCTDVTDKTLNWGGAGGGGWGRSWQQWANGGRGGAVCQRTLAWTSNGWTVQN